MLHLSRRKICSEKRDHLTPQAYTTRAGYPRAAGLESSGYGGKQYNTAPTNPCSRANCKHPMRNWRRSDNLYRVRQEVTTLTRHVGARRERFLWEGSQACESSSRRYGSRNKEAVRNSDI